jgi:hypothetical protein
MNKGRVLTNIELNNTAGEFRAQTGEAEYAGTLYSGLNASRKRPKIISKKPENKRGIIMAVSQEASGGGGLNNYG